MRRVIVIGNGMVGARFAEELAMRDSERRHDILVLGAEEHEPYNRVLLSDYVAGRVSTAALALGGPVGHAVVQRGRTVAAVDRARRLVVLRDGDEQGYDILVFATGARARVLPLRGLDIEALAPGVHVLRTLDDAREIVAATMNARRAIVIGGGVLGLEAAAGLAQRGLQVTVVHATDAVMERQLTTDASVVAVDALSQAGVRCELMAASHAIEFTAGRASGLELADGRVLPCDLVVMACGTVPDIELAQRAGLSCGRGIVVGHDLATPSDAAVFAIGDCASPPDGGTGLIAQGWEQARRLAEHLIHGEPPAAAPTDTSPTDVVRVKGAGLDIVAMGRRGPQDRVVRLADPTARRFVEVAVHDGRLVGATCVGAGAVAADLIAAYTRATPVPNDPAALLLRPLATQAVETGSPTTMPERFTVCRCNGVTKRAIMQSWAGGARTRPEVAARTRATTGCGGCGDVVEGILDWLRASDPDPGPSQPAPNVGAHQLTAAKHSPHGGETSDR